MRELLAWYKYPEAEGKSYCQQELLDEQLLIELFGYCKDAQAYISAEGWVFLIEHYGYEKLFELNKMSAWIASETLDDYKNNVNYYSFLGKENIR
ncbi:hypothetical protein ACFO26_03735 [Lactococcus nasutitermitis]|uniref:Uncharacterized protein n=1 Tax=Lactococcus nasutitermitis TaxID=1652957 RepID=A0ABV9JF80_9LACT|nr:hypothetical protein [Lactococcus nasutitermitis]